MSHNFLYRYPPIALQPSLGHFFSHVNEEWRKGYKTGVSHAISSKLSNVVVVSVSGGIHDYQVPLSVLSLILCRFGYPYAFFKDKIFPVIIYDLCLLACQSILWFHF
jgi:hypothetical protein